MPETTHLFEADEVAVMYAVSEGQSATDAWLDYLRARYPEAIDALARAAMASIALDLLVSNGDMTIEEASRQMIDAATSATAAVGEEVWISAVRMRDVLQLLERRTAESSVLIDVREDEPALHRFVS